MWADAVALLNRAEKLHRTLYQPGPSTAGPIWEPPADMFETEHELWIMFALPGVAPSQLQMRIENGVLVVAGERRMPDSCRAARIFRIEIPQGPFERRLPLPAGRYELGRRELIDGCLTITLTKTS